MKKEINYKEFYRKELFPKKEIEITDEFLVKHDWHKYGDICNRKTKWYYFDNGILGRINVDATEEKHKYTLHINYESQDSRQVSTVSDIKAAIYSYVCGQQGCKYGYDPKAKGYKYLKLDTDEEKNEWRYKKYKELVKAIK